MSRATAATRSLEAFLVAGLLLGCPLAAHAQPASAGDAAFDGSWLELATEGTTDHFQPRATFRLDRAAYVAVFEVEPGVGATLLYPHGADRQVRLSEGEHGFRLNGVQQAFNRRMMLAHLSQAFTHRDPVVPYNHLVAVGSTRPLELDGLLSGRIFAYTRGFAGVEEVTGALLAEVLGERAAGEWTIARTSYLKFRSEPLLFAFRDLQANAPFLVLGTELQLLGLEADPRIPELVTCLFGTETLAAFYHGLGAVGPDVDCRRRLKALDVPGVELPATIASGPSSGASCDAHELLEGRVYAALSEVGPGEVMLRRITGRGEGTSRGLLSRKLDDERRELLARAADAGRSLGPDAGEVLEHLGVELRRTGAAVPLERMRRLRAGTDGWRDAVRARAERSRRPGAIGFRHRSKVVSEAAAQPRRTFAAPTAGGDAGGGAVPDVDVPERPDRETPER